MSGDQDSPVVSTAGVLFGLKLPTGKTTETNAQGVPAERSLQPGTGTLDALIGGYFRQTLPLADFSWFAQAVADLPLYSYDNYRPGNS